MASELKTEAEPSSAQDMPHGGEPSDTDSQTHSFPDLKQCQGCASAGDMTATLKDIREFMRSAMKSLDIPLPKADDVEIDLSLLKPNGSMYNEETVLDFWRKRIPTRELLESLCNTVLLEFKHLDEYVDQGISPVTSGNQNVANGKKLFDLVKEKWPKSLGVPENEIEAKCRPPFKILFNWNLRPEGRPWVGIAAPVLLKQWSYDEDGYPTDMPLDDYRIVRRDFALPVRITRILRFGTS
jgi:hypothetical protein